MTGKGFAMEKFTSKDGTTLAYERSGSGPPLLLVHGATADHHRWGPVKPALEQHFTLYMLDRRGRGESGDAPEYAIAREVEDIAAFAGAAFAGSVGGPVNLLGHSFGAACSLEAALISPNIERLILYEPPPPGVSGMVSGQTAERLRKLLAAGDRDAVVSTFLSEVARIPEEDLSVMRAASSWQGRIEAAHTILREIECLEQEPPFDPRRFAKFEIPTLLLLGGDSPALYRDHITALHAHIASSQLVELPGQQHVAMNTAPELFTREVLAFLQADASNSGPKQF
jgi:pimeloyl-ACP methyl ester carboxylesterase